MQDNIYIFCPYHGVSSVSLNRPVVGSNKMKKFIGLTHLIKSIQ